jgi:uncharacterized protein YyaL (SSP411 family)
MSANLLAGETSPYLLQHAGNPVHWMPWGEAAFERARSEDKPLFLSIGYSTCHWCHVMAHESFEDPALAAQLNEDFVCVKVDREERPDVDRVYMAFVQAATGHGGWPLSAWLTPDLAPFYGGTYYPPADLPGRPGFGTVLSAIARAWREQRPRLIAEGGRMLELLQRHASGGSDGESIDEGSLAGEVRAAAASCLRHYTGAFDARHGGFGGAPKFPRASDLHFLLHTASGGGAPAEEAELAVGLATATLRGLARGGIHDAVGGGFHRYSVDEAWFVPHFEKMLYDQAQLASAFLDAQAATGDARYGWIARDVLEYVTRDLAAADGGFHSAEDADSPEPDGTGHREGAFYVWTPAEIADALAGIPELESFAPALAAHFGVKPEGNVPERLDPQGEFRGRNILAQARTLAETAREAGLDLEVASSRLAAALARLRETRKRRPPPHRDDKVIAAWNGMMVSALVRAHFVLGPDSDWMGHAERTGMFLEKEMYDSGRGLLLRSFRSGRATTPAFAEDYACIIQALLDLYEGTLSIRWLRLAVRLQETMDRLFRSGEGAYFDASADDPSLIVRLKDSYDGAEPAASSVAALNLVRLGAYFDGGPGAPKGGYRAQALATVAAFRQHWIQAPQALPRMLDAARAALAPPAQVVLAGEPQAPATKELQSVVLGRPPGCQVSLLHVPMANVPSADRDWLLERVPWIADVPLPPEGRATAQLCRNFTCGLPLSEAGALRDAIGS